MTKTHLTSADAHALLDGAVRLVAPVWPLRHFVAVNPWLGLTDRSFAEAAVAMAKAAGARATMPRAFYAEAIESGRIAPDHLAAALEALAPMPGLPRDAAALATAARAAVAEPEAQPTLADLATRVTGDDWSAFALDRVASFAAAAFDEGQAAWRPDVGDDLWRAWRDEAAVDRTPEVLGLGRFRAIVGAMPDEPGAAVAAALSRLDLSGGAASAYLHRLAMSVGGWMAVARHRLWQAELHGGTDRAAADLLAIRLAIDVALLDVFGGRIADAWRAARPGFAEPGDVASFAPDLALQTAYEIAWQQNFFAAFGATRTDEPAARPALQAAFCIDVRSEVFRRALETVEPGTETIGFAGFFGLPIEYVPLGQTHGGAQCPVLLTPKLTVCESVKGATRAEETEILGLRLLRRRAGKAWKAFRAGAVSSFAFVETMGLGYGAKLATDALGRTRTVAHPSADGLDASDAASLAPRLEAAEVAGRTTGFPAEARLDMAEAILRAMSMTGPFARLVLLAGHGSTTVNNPHATGLDCGACGGHTGEANARVAAMVLNDPEVRTGLAARGIAVPEDTHFLGCLHDTTTDEVAIYDADAVPASHAADLSALKERLAAAGGLARAERAHLLNLGQGEAVDAAVMARSRDWSQVRPEWGLAGCAAFVAAPRHRTAGLDLGGRSFLHSYDWRQDQGFGTLELIMTAPMVVASWISLQYYGSTVDNRVFGAGNKLLHNVTGTIGVLEGNGGDLRTGLPWQSVHDGERLIHEPMRLQVVIEAPVDAMNAVIEKHTMVRDLLDNGWLKLAAMGADGRITAEYQGGLTWAPVGPAVSEAA